MKRLAFQRAVPALALILATLSSAAGCGHNEEEWQGKLNEIKALDARLKKAEEDRKKCNDDLAANRDELAALRTENDVLKGKTGDLSKQSQDQLAR